MEKISMENHIVSETGFHNEKSLVDEVKGSFCGEPVNDADLGTLGTSQERTGVAGMTESPKLMKYLDSQILKVAKRAGVAIDIAWACFRKVTRDGHEDDEDFEFNWYACTRAEKDSIIDLTFVKLSSEIKMHGLMGRVANDLGTEDSVQG